MINLLIGILEGYHFHWLDTESAQKNKLAQEEEKKIDEILERERINAEIKSVNDFIALQEERKIKALRKELERERIIIGGKAVLYLKGKIYI